MEITNEDRAALNYLRSLDPETKIELPDINEPSTPVSAAVEQITGGHCRVFADRFGTWEWTAGELAATLAADLFELRD